MSDWSTERSAESQQIMMWMMGAVQQKQYEGVFVVPGAPILIESGDRPALGAWLAQALGNACGYWGGLVIDQTDADEDLDHEAPAEQLVIGAMMPVTRSTGGLPAQERGMAEATMEVIRVLLCGAIITAIEDRNESERRSGREVIQNGEPVIVAFKGMPEVEFTQDLVNGTITVVSSAIVKVFRGEVPRRSYVLGNVQGKKGKRLEWSIPLADLFYGPSRIRWLDMRSPGHVQHEQIARALG